MEYYNKYNSNFSDSEIFVLKNKNNDFKCNNITIINNRGIHNDIVYVKDNKVIGIKERNRSKIVGVLFLNKNTKFGVNGKGYPYYLFKPLNNKYPNFYVASKSREKRKIYVVIEFLRWNESDKQPYGMITDIIGEIDIINNEYKALLYKNNLIYPKFKVLKFKLDNHIKRDNNLQKSQPEYYVFSIDPKGCKDIDDAFHYKELDSGFEIGVHITDITQYFSYDEIINLNKSSSIYLPNEIKYLLPEIYSEDLCSLIKNRIRKTIMVLFTYSSEYKLISTKIKYSIVKVRQNYNYDQVDKLISYEEKTNLHRFFDTIKNISNKINDSHTAVEYYMIEANKFIAEELYKKDPKNTILRTYNGNKINFNEDDCLNNYLNTSGIESANYICTTDDDKIKHNILETKYYTHFTSPIRRLPDIYIHHQLKMMINDREFYEIENTKIDNMNKFQKNTRKLYNDIKKINIIYDLQENYETVAYIIDFNERNIKLYLPEFKITHKTTLYSNKISDLLEINLKDDSISLKNNNESVTYNLYQKINVRLNSLIQEDSILKKLHIHIISDFF